MTFVNNHPLPITTFRNLVKHAGAHSVSVYLAMYKRGSDLHGHLSQAILKGCIKEARKELAKYQIPQLEITNYLRPLYHLLEEGEIWRNPSEGLAIFLDQKGLKYYTLPISFDTKVYVASQFYLLPLFPLYQEDRPYFVLKLSQDYVRLYQATGFTITDITDKVAIPQKIEDVVGKEFEAKTLQRRNSRGIAGGNIIHGYGEGKDDVKKELSKFYKAIDEAFLKTVGDSKPPLILSCTDEVFSHYKNVSKYPQIFEKNLAGDPEFITENDLHKATHNLLNEYFNSKKNQKIETFNNHYITGNAGFQIAEILPMAIDGKVDTLFVQRRADLYGIYDKVNRRLRLDSQKNNSNVSLMNLASLETFLQGGNVFYLDAADMPVKGYPINAIFRY